MKRWTALLLALAMLALAACAKGGTDWKEQYDLGAKYLSDGNYQEAILAFSAAIEIEPKAADAYVGRADAYVGAAVELADGGITPGTEQSGQILTYLQNAEADYETALSLAEAGGDLSESVETVEQKLAETTERKNQVAEREEAAAGSDIIPEDSAEEEELEAARAETARTLALLDYGLIVTALEEMGAQELCWTCRDSDQSGYPELYIEAVTSPVSGRYGQLFADAETEDFEAYTATGAAGGSSFCLLNLDGNETVLWSQGYYTIGTTFADYLAWNGDWETFASMSQEGSYDENGAFQASGEANWNGEPVSLEEFSTLEMSALTMLDYDNPALDSVTVSRAWPSVLETVENWAEKRGLAWSGLTDLDSDGLKEQVFLLQGAANFWFDRLSWEMLWEDELFLDYRDARTTAIVASQSGDGVLLRMVRLDGWSGTEPEVTADGLILDGTAYTYHSAGTALTVSTSALNWSGVYVYNDGSLGEIFAVTCVSDQTVSGVYVYGLASGSYSSRTFTWSISPNDPAMATEPFQNGTDQIIYRLRDDGITADYPDGWWADRDYRYVCKTENASQYIDHPALPADLTAAGKSETGTVEPEPDPVTADVRTPFYGIWTGAFQNRADADAFAAAMQSSGLPAAVYLTSDWSNLNAAPWYVISAGEYATEAEANAALSSVQAAGYDNAYVKYTGNSR